jgi:uncharacterized protein
MKKPLIFLIRTYQAITRPFASGKHGCHFYPTCSDYAIGCIQKYGAIKGISLSAKRIWRCRPGAEPGIDLIP